MKKYSNLKRMGAKSIHYNNESLYVESNSPRKSNILFECKFENIDKLQKCKSIVKYDKKNNNTEFVELPNQKGFSLIKCVRGKTLETVIKNVKKVSYIQGLLGLSTDNNFEIQIYNNFEDMKKVITSYCNNVLYTINTVYRDISGEEDYIFDKIGSIPVNTDYLAFLEDNAEERGKWENEYLPNLEKVLKRFGINTQKTVHVNYIKCLQYVAHKCGATIHSLPNLSPKVKKQLDEMMLDEEKKNHLLQLAYTRASKLYSQAKSFTLYNYFFREKRVEKAILDKLAQDPILKTLERPIDPNNTTFNYVRMLSGIRQFVVHNKQKIRIENNTFVNDNVKRDVGDFYKRFFEENRKYFCVLRKVFNSDDMMNRFYEYCVYDDKKNIGISVAKVQKNIFKILNVSQDVAKENLSEYLNRLKTLVRFVVTNHLQENPDKLKEILVCLKNKIEDKDKIYNKLAEDVLSSFDNFQKLRRSVQKYLADVEITLKVDFYPKNIIKNQSVFLNSLYVMSKFLTVSEANEMFSRLINKYENTKSLLEIAKKANATILQNDFKSHKMLFIIDGSKIVEENPVLDSQMIENQLVQLRLLKGIRARECKIENDFSVEIKRIFNLFKTDLTWEECQKNDSLKAYFENEIFKSKEYQYISNFSSTEVCQKLVSNIEIVRFVVNDMLSQSNKDSKSNLRFLAKVYNNFECKRLAEENIKSRLDETWVDKLIEEVSSLSLEKLSNNFDNAGKNHKALVGLYLKVCYLIVKNIINQNSSYLIQIQDYENMYKIIYENPDAVYDMSIVNHFIENSQNKTCRSYKQLQALLNQEYIKELISNDNFDELAIKYRNTVVHSSLLNELISINYDFESIKNITSYFALYQSLMQGLMERTARKVWEDRYDKYFVDGNEKPYSTKLCIALNIPYSYNISRFNNLVIEKNAIKTNFKH